MSGRGHLVQTCRPPRQEDLVTTTGEPSKVAEPDPIDAIVVGAGWAGLGVSYWLARAGLRHRVLEQARIGETWRTQRWDLFRMNTPNVLTVMPGDHYEGPDPEGFMTCGEFVALLADFAEQNRLPVETGTPALALVPEESGF